MKYATNYFKHLETAKNEVENFLASNNIPFTLQEYKKETWLGLEYTLGVPFQYKPSEVIYKVVIRPQYLSREDANKVGLKCNEDYNFCHKLIYLHNEAFSYRIASCSLELEAKGELILSNEYKNRLTSLVETV